MPVIKIPEFITKILLCFRLNFSKPQFENFQTYITGLVINLEARNIQDIADYNLTYEKDQSSLNRSLTESPWDDNELQKLSYEILKEENLKKIKQNDNRPICFLIFDDIVIEKYGKNIEGAGWFYSNKEHKDVWGINVFSALVVVENLPFPMLLKNEQYYKKEYCEENKIEFKTKIQMSKEVVEKFKGFEGYHIIVLADSWYPEKGLINLIRERSYDWCFALRSNRKTYNKKGKKIKLSHLAKSLNFSNYKKYEIGERIFWATSRVIVLPEIGTARLVLSKEQTKGKKKKDIKKANIKFIATSLDYLTVKQILQIYSFRTKIENAFKDMKLHLGLGDCQMIIREGIKKHLSCVQAVYNFVYTVALTRGIEKEVKTIGEICLYIQKQFLISALNYCYELGKLNKKVDIEKILVSNY